MRLILLSIIFVLFLGGFVLMVVPFIEIILLNTRHIHKELFSIGWAAIACGFLLGRLHEWIYILPVKESRNATGNKPI